MPSQLFASGVKLTPEDVVATGIAPDGRIVWMETGNSRAGLQHIFSHTTDFAGIGVSQSDILSVVMAAIAGADVIGIQGHVDRA